MLRACSVRLLVAVLLIALSPSVGEAQYIPRQVTTTQGGVTFIGNALGLNKNGTLDEPGTTGSIGTFITTNTALRDNFSWPPGTTEDWRQNSSAAILNLPPNSRVVYAELIWGGSYLYGPEDVRAFLDNPIDFTTPAGLSQVAPALATRFIRSGPEDNYYGRTADVTALVTAGGNGTYTVGRVPATQSASEANFNAAGWTLAILYENSTLPARNLSLFVGLEQAGGFAAALGGFCTPTSGTVRGRVTVSAIEGDTNSGGDSLRFAPSLNALDLDRYRLAGPNNPITNFFASQINGDNGLLVTSGTFGTRNNNFFNSFPGGRQGWDITSVDASPQMVPGQTRAFARGTTTSFESFFINALALQIDVGTPAFSSAAATTVSQATAKVGDLLTYTVRFNNSGGTADANNVTMTAPLPPGMAFVTGSLTVDGVPSSANPVTGALIGKVAAGSTRVVTFKFRVDSVPAAPAPAQYDVTPSWTYSFVSCAGQPSQNGSFTTNTATTTIARIAAAKSALPASVRPAQMIEYRISVTNTGTTASSGTLVKDLIPAGTAYVTGSTTLNGTAVADQLGTSPLVLGMLVNSPGAAPGIVNFGEAADVRFIVRVDPSTTAAIVNTALIEPDGSVGALPEFPAPVTTPVTPTAEIVLTNVGPVTATAGTDITYVLTLTNQGPSTASDVVLANPTPPGLTLVSVTGDCTALPCSLGAVEAGAGFGAGSGLSLAGQRVVNVTFRIPGTYTTPDPIVSIASATTTTQDLTPGDDAASASTALAAPVTDLQITNTNGVNRVVPGQTVTYQIVVTNAGPSTAAAATVSDTFPLLLEGVTWTCVATSLAQCGTASGTGNINAVVTVPVGETVTFSATGTLATTASGTLVNEAQVIPSAGSSDPTPAAADDVDAIDLQADLSITVGGPASVALGGDIVFTSTITNNGPSEASNVVVEIDNTPDLILVSSTSSCTTSPCNLGTLARGQAITDTTTFRVPLDFQGNTVTNTTRLSSGVEDPDLTDNQSVTGVAIIRDADVALVKSVSPETVLVGEQATFILTLTNLGPAPASGLVVNDLLPAGLTLDSFSASQGSYVPATGEWTAGAVDAGRFATLTLVATLNLAETITNLATIVAKDQPDPDPSNDSSAAQVNGQPAADVGVAMTADNPAPPVGTTVTFTVTAANTGPSPATGVVVTDALPAGLTLVSATASQGSYTAPLWTVGDLNVGTPATLTIVASVDATGALVNQAQKTQQTEADPNPTNDSASVSLNAAASANLRIVKTQTLTRGSVGEAMTFNIVVANQGPSPATGVTVRDVLPPGMTFVSAAPEGAYDPATGIWTVGSLGTSSSAVLALTVNITQSGTQTNTASIASSDQPDPDPADDASSVTISAEVVADVDVAQAFTGSTVPGQGAGYTIVVTNHGPSNVANVTVTDLLPAVLVATSWTCTADPGSSCAAATGTGSIGTTVTLEAGDHATFNVTAAVDPAATGVLVNTVTVAVPPGVIDVDAMNDSATTSVPLTPAADLQISKDGPTTAVAGTNIVYTTVVTNAGPSDAVSVTAADVTPPGLTFVSNTGDCTTAYPCAFGTLAAGAVRTITTTYAIPSGYVAPDPITNTAAVASATPDPATANNSTTATTGLGNPVTDLRVTKTNGVSSLVPGQTTTYTITLTNNGPTDATGARLQDPFPAALTGVSWICTGSGGGACGAASGSGNLDIAVNVPVGASVVVTATGTVAPSATGFLANTATAVPPVGLAVRSTPTATDTDQLVPQADLRVTKTGPASVLPGNSIVYTTTVTNDGPSDATGVTVADPTPQGLAFVSNAGDCTTAFPCALGTVPAGATRTITATFSVPVGYAGPSPIANVAEVSATTPDPDASDNTASAETTVNRSADLQVVKSVSPATVLVGEQATFTVTVTNAGPARAQGLVVRDSLPVGLTLDSFAVSQGSYVATTGDWTVGAVDAGQSATLTLLATLEVTGAVTNLATITEKDQPDPDTSNDSAAAVVNGAPAADIAVTKTVDNPTPVVGTTVTFTVTATNRGPTGATGVVVTDALPAGLTLVSATPSQGDYTAPAWTVGALAVDAAATLVIVATVDTPGSLVNRAEKTQQVEADPNPANDSASVTLNAAASANLKIVMVATRSTVSVGETLSFNVQVVNLGPSPATGVRVSDVLPPGLTFVSANPAAAYDGITGLWTVGELDANAPAVLALTVRATQAGPLTNTASIVASDQPDPDPTDNAASATVTAVFAAEVGVTQAFTGAPTPGLAAGYTIVVTNLGPSDVAGVTVTDLLPAGLVSPAWTCVASAGSSCAAAAGTGSIATTVTLQAGATATFTVAATIAAGATATLVNTVTAAVPPGVTDGDATNNSATTTVPLTPSADVQIVKSGPASAVAGTNVVYTTVVTNAGPSDAVAVTVADPTPPGLTFVSNAGACVTAYPCALGTLASGAVSTITTTYAIPSGYLTPDPIVNTATVTSTTLDPVPSNNSSAAMTGLGVPLTDLRVTKSNGVSSLVPGETTTYTITVTNNGPSDALNVRVRDDFPVALTGVSWTCSGSSGGSCNAASGTGNINVNVDVPVGATIVVSATGTVAANATGVLVNTASVELPPGQATLSTPIATDTDQLLPQADLRVTKTAPASVLPGNPIVYTITVANDGLSDAAGVTVADPTPQGLTFVSNAGDCTTAFPCALGAVAAGATRTITATFSVPAAYSGASPIVNVAEVSATTPDPDASDNTASADTAVIRDADVGVVMSVSPATVLAGEQATFTVTVSNTGPAHASGVVVRDLLSAGMTLDSFVVSQGSYVQSTGVWTVGAVDAGQSATLTLVATLEAAGQVLNLAVITAADQPDPDTSNNAAAAAVNGTPAADVAVTKTVDNATPAVGSTVTFIVTATNRGPTGATGVVVTDALPAGLTLVSATPSQGGYTAPTWTVGALLPNASATLVIVATVDTAGGLVNRADKTQQVEADPNPTNDGASVTLNSAASANLKIVKAATRSTVSVGETLTFYVLVANLGPSPATGVRVSDPLPPGLTFVSAKPAAAYDAATGVWTVGGLAANRPALLALTVRVTQPGALTNTASIAASDQPDPDPTDNAASATVTAAVAADVSVTQAFTGATTPGLAAGYAIVVTNLGPSDVAGVTVTDGFPPLFTGLTWTCTASAGSTCASPSGTGAIGTTVTLEAGDTATFTVAAVIAASATGTLANTVTVAVPTGVTDGNTTNNSATTSVALTPAADLQIVKDGPIFAAAGANLVYTNVITNGGPSDAVAVTVSDTTPPGLTFVSNAGACTTAYPCTLGTLAAGTAGTITTTYAIPAAYVTPDPIVNTATVASATLDPAAANNSSSATTQLGVSVTDLRIAKTNGVSSLVPGQTTAYTITVTNNGPSAAFGARVRDVFPLAFTGVSWTCSGSAGGACGVASGAGDIDIVVDVPVGATVLVTASGTVAADATGVLVNTATVEPPAGMVSRRAQAATDVDVLLPQADLRLTKTGPASAVRGDSIVYTITIINAGPSNAAGVTVSDPTPPGLVFVSNAGDCTTAFPCALGSVPAGATRTITATFSVAVGYGGPSIANVAAVLATTPDPDAANNTATADASLSGDADVEVTKVVPASGVLVGAEIEMTINALNRGPNPATGIAITDQLPSGFDFVSASATQGAYDAATGIWSVGSLGVSDAAQLTLTVLVTEPGPITNLAVKTDQNEPDPNTSNDSAAGSTAAAPAADLAVEMDVDRRVAPVGETVTFTVRATNRGPSPATGVELTDALPAGLSFVSAAASLGSYDQVTGIWTVGPLDAVAQATLTLVATVDQAGPLVNNAAVTAQAEADPNPLNRRDAVLLNGVSSSADLSVTKAVSQTTPGLGSLVSYTIAVTNLGPDDATSAEIGDPLPAGVVFESASASQGSYDAGTGAWTLGALPVTRSATLTLTGRVTQTGPLVNTATRLSSAPLDPNAANDVASATLTAAIVADVSVVKTPSAPTIAAGAPLAWTITVANSGPSTAAGVAVSDAFSPVFFGVTWTCTATAGSACALPSGAGAIGTTVDLAAGGSATFVANGAVDPAFVGNLVNTASAAVASGTTDPDPANNSASSTVAAGKLADVQLTTTGPASASPGTTIQYVSTIVNAGPSQAEGATLFLVNSRGGLTAVASTCASLPCALGSLAPGETRDVTSSVSIPPDYTGPVTLVVRQAVNTQSFDPVPANNSTVVTTTIGSGSGADLSISKAGPATTNRGQQVTYTIMVANAGPAGATGVTVHDPTPAGLTFVSNGGDCVTAFPCDLATMAAGTTRIITATYAVATGTSGPSTITNTASVQSGTGDPDVANNSASVMTRLPSGAKCDFDGDGLDEIVTGAGPSGGPHVRLLKVSGATVTELAGFYAYEPTFRGGAFVACGDVTGDGLPEIITGAGAGGSPHVRVFAVNAPNVTEIASFHAYADTFRGGVHVAAADTTGDGVAEIITGAGPSGGPHVRVLEFNGGDLRELASFYAYDVKFRGGVSVAGADIDGDGLAEVITGAGPSGGPHVRVIRVSGGSLTELTGFYAYDPTFFLGGVDVAAADVTGDGIAEIITGAGPSGGPHVKVIAFDGANLTELTGFYAYDPTYFLGGVHVAAADVTGDGIAEIITGAGPSGGPHVKVIAFDGTDLTVLASFYAYDPTYFLGGVHVASAETPREGEAATVLAQGFRGGAVNGQLVNGLALARITRSWAADLAGSSRVTVTRLAASWPASTPSRLHPAVPNAAEVRRFAPMIRSPPREASSEGFSARARGSPT